MPSRNSSTRTSPPRSHECSSLPEAACGRPEPAITWGIGHSIRPPSCKQKPTRGARTWVGPRWRRVSRQPTSASTLRRAMGGRPSTASSVPQRPVMGSVGPSMTTVLGHNTTRGHTSPIRTSCATRTPSGACSTARLMAMSGPSATQWQRLGRLDCRRVSPNIANSEALRTTVHQRGGGTWFSAWDGTAWNSHTRPAPPAPLVRR